MIGSHSATICSIAASVLCLAYCLGLHAEEKNTANRPSAYLRFPTIHGTTVVFTAEGDLWKVPIQGGLATRITTHPGYETQPQFSPDGKTLAFMAQYEGPGEVYTMPAEGGLPTRRTYLNGEARIAGWSPEGKLLISAGNHWQLPDRQISAFDLHTGTSTPIPLSQASLATMDPSQKTMVFTRLPFHGGSIKRYKGGTAENLWKFVDGQEDAVPLTADYAGTSTAPMWWQNRIYFVSDRDGFMNLWSMNDSGADLKQLTAHKGWDVKTPHLNDGRIVYQYAGDIHLYEIATAQDTTLPVQLTSDWDHRREKWIKKPMEFVTATHLSPKGDRVVLTARGQVFVAPAGPGRLIQVTQKQSVRYRNAQFSPTNDTLIALSDESGEVELVKLPADGLGTSAVLTTNGTVLKGEPALSPDGQWAAWPDKNLQLWILNLSNKEVRLIASAPHSEPTDLCWSPDSRWLAYVIEATNQFSQIWIYDSQNGNSRNFTSERVDSRNPVWSPDGKWMYFLSERHLNSVVGSPWGSRQPDPFFDKSTELYLVALQPGLHSPFEPTNEVMAATTPALSNLTTNSAATNTNSSASTPSTNKSPLTVLIEWNGIQQRTYRLPVIPGNYDRLEVNDKRLFWTSRDSDDDAKTILQVMDITSDEPKPKNLAEDIRSFELSADGKKLLIRKGDNLHIEEASASAPAKLEKQVDLKDWTFSIRPTEEWRQLFVEAWRLERDYFYDRNMHGVNWPAVLQKYLPLVDRIADRGELSEVISDMVSELAALHIRVNGGDLRQGVDKVEPARLGAELQKDPSAGGWRIARIYKSDPDYPEKVSPLARPGIQVNEGDILVAINGVPTLNVDHPYSLLRNKAGKQVLIQVQSPTTPSNDLRNVIVKPISAADEASLRYSEWEYTRRLRVEEVSEGQIGYLHLRAMGKDDIAQWAREFYPVYRRQGLIIDVRHNRGGNIDSWILGKLLRKAWFFWQPRVGAPTWNMQYAFRGHMAVICDEFTASDGEAFAEGFKRLGLGKVIGKRTWGGEIWLSANNWLVDRGIATAAEIGVYGPEGQWLIEGHGVEPDIVVDNLPHATFKGQDAQLDAAIRHLQEEIRKKPVTVPPPPPHPDKSFR